MMKRPSTAKTSRQRRLLAALVGCATISFASASFADVYSNPYASQGSVTNSIHLQKASTKARLSNDFEVGKVRDNPQLMAPTATKSAPAMTMPNQGSRSLALPSTAVKRPTRLPTVNGPSHKMDFSSQKVTDGSATNATPKPNAKANKKKLASGAIELPAQAIQKARPFKPFDANRTASVPVKPTEPSSKQAAAPVVAMQTQVAPSQPVMHPQQIIAPQVVATPQIIAPQVQVPTTLEVPVQVQLQPQVQVRSPVQTQAPSKIEVAASLARQMDPTTSTANRGNRSKQLQQSARWLPATTSTSSQQECLRHLDTAMQEFKRRAWASAEDSAWQSLRHAAESIDLAERNASFGTRRSHSGAASDLQAARDAIREARDFAGKYGTMDVAAMERLALSHSTTVLKDQSLQNVSPTDAADRYLDEARQRLARLATYRPEAAQAADLLAAIYLARGDLDLLPNQTALCLRRAALQGQPHNADLAERLGMHLAATGLDAEAKWALEHAMSISPSQMVYNTLAAVQQRAGDRDEALRVAAQIRSRLPAGVEHPRGGVPDIVQLSPAEFARVSKPVVPHRNSFAAEPGTTQRQASRTIQAKPASARMRTSSPNSRQDFGDMTQRQDKKGFKSAVGKVVDKVKFW